MKTLILGGMRSGKNRLAERLARESRQPVTYIARRSHATAYRGTQHPSEWTVIEEPFALDAFDGVRMVDVGGVDIFDTLEVHPVCLIAGRGGQGSVPRPHCACSATRGGCG